MVAEQQWILLLLLERPIQYLTFAHSGEREREIEHLAGHFS